MRGELVPSASTKTVVVPPIVEAIKAIPKAALWCWKEGGGMCEVLPNGRFAHHHVSHPKEGHPTLHIRREPLH